MLPIPKNGGRFRQGIFKPKHPEKYIGQQPIRFLSSLELKFLLFCDNNSNILEYASEGVIIPYLNPLDGKYHRYFTDAIIAIKEGDQIKKYLIEIKPKKQTLPPEFRPKQRESTKVYETKQWIQNQAKWNAAKKWCIQKSGNNPKDLISFQLLTEENLH